MDFLLKIEASSDTDDQEKIELVRHLRKELLALNAVESVQSPQAPAVPGAKSVGIDWQTLIVTMAASGGVLTTLISTIQSWLKRRESTSVTLEVGEDKLIITAASSETQKRLVDDWINRRKQ
jgi:hypothetical protein